MLIPFRPILTPERGNAESPLEAFHNSLTLRWSKTLPPRWDVRPAWRGSRSRNWGSGRDEFRRRAPDWLHLSVPGVHTCLFLLPSHSLSSLENSLKMALVAGFFPSQDKLQWEVGVFAHRRFKQGRLRSGLA